MPGDPATAAASRILISPDPQGGFYRHNGLLALYRPVNTSADYWTSHWQDEERRKRLLKAAESDGLAPYAALVQRYVPRHLPVLEAGCGLGQVVAALVARGYDARGVEYDADTVAFVNREFPELKVTQGDVKALGEIPDASLGCYMSLGVLEHFEEGPVGALHEVQRILHADGVGLISVPFLNPAREAFLRQAPASPPPGENPVQFYQYYFSVRDFKERLSEAGLELIDTRPLFVAPHLLREHPGFLSFWRSPLCRQRMRPTIRRAIEQLPVPAKRRYAHMMMYVCRRRR
jgi:SAM-dependent methyltransferase